MHTLSLRQCVMTYDAGFCECAEGANDVQYSFIIRFSSKATQRCDDDDCVIAMSRNDFALFVVTATEWNYRYVYCVLMYARISTMIMTTDLRRCVRYLTASEWEFQRLLRHQDVRTRHGA